MTDILESTNATTSDDPMAVVGRLTECLNAASLVLGIDAGHRAGAIEALAAAGPSTSEELARQTGFSERHLREWLRLMTVGGIVTYDPESGRHSLPPGAAMCLTGDSMMNMAPTMAAIAFSAKHVDAVATSIREGGGIPYSAYRPEFTELMDAMNRRLYDAVLVDGHIAAVPGLHARLVDGIRVADIGCGTGHVLNLLARAYPASTFTGYDLAADALDAGRREAAAWGLTNVAFESADVAALPADASFDCVLAFDAIHDQVAPRQVLGEVRRVLAPEGVFVMVDVHASSHLENNLAHPLGTWLYAASLFHCMQVSLAEGGEGLGTVWGVELATELLHEAGFADVTVVDTPEMDVLNTMFVCRPTP